MTDEELTEKARECLVGLTGAEFDRRPLVIRGESKEVRYLGEGLVAIRFLDTIYSFTANRCDMVMGSARWRLESMAALLPVLRAAGLRHAYLAVDDRFAVARLVVPDPVEYAKYGLPAFTPPDLSPEEFARLPRAPPIEVILKRAHTGTSKHRYRGMNGARVRPSHPLYAGAEIRPEDTYPELVVRFDWRNPIRTADGERVADEALPTDLAHLFLDAPRAAHTARHLYAALQDHLGARDIVVYDLCAFIAEDGELIYGEVSPDCGRFRHFHLGSVDKDVWRGGGSSAQVLEKWRAFARLAAGPPTYPAAASAALYRYGDAAMDLTLGTTNPSKVGEYAAMCPAGVKLIPYGENEPEETEDTFLGNARVKSSAYARATGRVTLAEDSGLCVWGLDGLPGVHSARFADCFLSAESPRKVTGHVPSGRPRAFIDAVNTERVCSMVAGMSPAERRASFCLALVVAAPDGTSLFETESRFDGEVIEEPRGSNGFGYDPIFVGDDCGGLTCAELDAHRKNLRSHRRQALVSFTHWLARVLQVREEARVVVDGNDGTGKTTLVAGLRSMGYLVEDRGLPTRMTDGAPAVEEPDAIYLILDAPVEVSRERLKAAGKNLEERYHTEADLTHYRARFQEVARALPRCHLIPAAGSDVTVLSAALRVLMA